MLTAGAPPGRGLGESRGHSRAACPPVSAQSRRKAGWRQGARCGVLPLSLRDCLGLPVGLACRAPSHLAGQSLQQLAVDDTYWRHARVGLESLHGFRRCSVRGPIALWIEESEGDQQRTCSDERLEERGPAILWLGLFGDREERLRLRGLRCRRSCCSRLCSACGWWRSWLRWSSVAVVVARLPVGVTPVPVQPAAVCIRGARRSERHHHQAGSDPAPHPRLLSQRSGATSFGVAFQPLALGFRGSARGRSLCALVRRRRRRGGRRSGGRSLRASAPGRDPAAASRPRSRVGCLAAQRSRACVGGLWARGGLRFVGSARPSKLLHGSSADIHHVRCAVTSAPILDALNLVAVTGAQGRHRDDLRAEHPVQVDQRGE